MFNVDDVALLDLCIDNYIGVMQRKIKGEPRQDVRELWNQTVLQLQSLRSYINSPSVIKESKK